MKILFFDIDGTLTDEKTGLIPESAKRAIKEAQNNGHLCFVNTGRPISTVPKPILDLGLDGYVCGCGSYIEYQGTTLLESHLEKELCLEIVQMLQKTHMSGVLEGTDGVYFDAHEMNKTILAIKDRYTKDGFDTTKTWIDDDLSFDKATCWINENSDFQTFHDFMTHHFEGICRGEDFYEYIQKEYSKATGIQFLLDYFHLELKDAYAFGDSTNDLSMLEYVTNSTAMGCACQEVKNAVAYTTTDVIDDGIKNALQYWRIIE